MEKSFYEECRVAVLTMLDNLENESKPKETLRKRNDLDKKIT